MKNFKTIENFEPLTGNDNLDFYKILNINFKTGRELSNLLKKEIKIFEASPIWEFFVKLDNNNKINLNLEKLWKYFNLLEENKIWSRWIWYYWLFWDAYKVENRKKYKEKYKQFWESFWKEYDEYISILSKIKENPELKIIYLDNLRNFILFRENVCLYIYLLLLLLKVDSHLLPQQKLHFVTYLLRE